MKPLRAVIVEKDDSLWKIAGRELNDCRDWTILAHVNGVKPPRYIIHPGDLLVLPQQEAGDFMRTRARRRAGN